MKIALTVATGGLIACAGLARAQDVVFTLLQDEDISILSDAESPTAESFFVGSNPSAIAFDGRSLFVGGLNNGSAAFQVRVVQILDVLNFDGSPTRSFLPVAGSDVDTSNVGGPVAIGRGYQGLDFDDQFGLFGTVDFGSAAQAGQHRIFGPQATGDGFELDASSVGLAGTSGNAYDYGFDGMGFALSGGAMGPVASVLDFRTNTASPFGLDPQTMDVPAVYAPGDVEAPVVNNPPLGGTIWRDIDYHRGTGAVAARANNGVVILPRNSDNSTGAGIAVNPDPGGAFTVGQNVEIVSNPGCGDDFVMWNSRINGLTQAFSSSINLSRLSDGAALSYSVVDTAGQPAALPDSAGYYSFYWYEELRYLFVCDFASRRVFVLQPECGGDVCVADWDDSSSVDIFDILAFLQSWNAQDPRADVNDSGMVDIFDILDFLGLWNAGCP